MKLASQPEKDNFLKHSTWQLHQWTFLLKLQEKLHFSLTLSISLFPLVSWLFSSCFWKSSSFFSCTGPDCVFVGFVVKLKTSLFSVFCPSQRFHLLLGLLNYSQSKQCCHLYFMPDCHAWRMILPFRKSCVVGFSCSCFLTCDFWKSAHIEAPGWIVCIFVLQLSQHFQALSLCETSVCFLRNFSPGLSSNTFHGVL